MRKCALRVEEVRRFLGHSWKATLFRKLKETRDEAIVPLQQLRHCGAAAFNPGRKEGESATKQNSRLVLAVIRLSSRRAQPSMI